MKEKLLRFTFRTTHIILNKLNYIANYNGRSSNKELEQLVIKYIKDFEKEHGSINLDDLK